MNNVKAAAIVGFLAVASLSADVTPAGDTYSRDEAARYILASEAEWTKSVATSHASVVKRILAGDCVWVFDGEVWDKARAVTDAAEGPGDFPSNHLDYAHVRFFGDTAVVQDV